MVEDVVSVLVISSIPCHTLSLTHSLTLSQIYNPPSSFFPFPPPTSSTSPAIHLTSTNFPCRNAHRRTKSLPKPLPPTMGLPHRTRPRHPRHPHPRRLLPRNRNHARRLHRSKTLCRTNHRQKS